MTQDIYESLAVHLDGLPGGFPRTESGVEMRILKRLFTEDEAALACRLRAMPEPVERIAKRTGLPPEELSDKLYRMSIKGLVFRADTPEGPRYMAAQYVVGIWEYQVNDLDEGLIKDMNEYIPHLIDPFLKLKTKQLRTIPIGASLDGQGAVMPYEEARKLIEQQNKIVVAPCICRREHSMIGKGCGKLAEACLIFSGAAHFYEKNGLGRPISREEKGGRRRPRSPTYKCAEDYGHVPLLRRLLPDTEKPQEAPQTLCPCPYQLLREGQWGRMYRL